MSSDAKYEVLRVKSLKQHILQAIKESSKFGIYGPPSGSSEGVSSDGGTSDEVSKVWSGSNLTKNSIKLSKIDWERTDRARLDFTIV